MYGKSLNENYHIDLAILIFNDFEYFEHLCFLVIENWEISCSENLNNKNINRVAWLGQAALNIVDSIPESCTKKAWKYLDSETQNALNLIALNKIKIYEKNCKKIHKKMGASLF
jgi:hypothetical protein